MSRYDEREHFLHYFLYSKIWFKIPFYIISYVCFLGFILFYVFITEDPSLTTRPYNNIGTYWNIFDWRAIFIRSMYITVPFILLMEWITPPSSGIYGYIPTEDGARVKPFYIRLRETVRFIIFKIIIPILLIIVLLLLFII